MLPWATVVCAKALDDKSRAERVIKASTMNRVLGREIFCFNIVSLPFGNMLVVLLDIESRCISSLFCLGKSWSSECNVVDRTIHRNNTAVQLELQNIVSIKHLVSVSCLNAKWMDSSKLEIALAIYMIFWRLGLHRGKPAAHPHFTTGGPDNMFCLDLIASVSPNT